MKKIRESEDKELTFYILKSAVQVGINGSMDDLTMNLLVDFVKKYYGNLEISQYSEAFEFYAAQKLDFKEKPYNNFSTAFVGLILNSYKEWLRKANLKPKAYIPPSHQIGNDLDPIVEMEKAFKFIQRVYKESKEFPIIANWSDAFLYAQANGLINLSLEQKKQIEKEVIEEIEKKQMNKRLESGVKGSQSEFDESNVKVLCRKKVLKTYIR
tara:strand:+ start:2751 stop:3386 length:636 start_codon:yes stop_codon:yes gene_type:complete